VRAPQGVYAPGRGASSPQMPPWHQPAAGCRAPKPHPAPALYTEGMPALLIMEGKQIPAAQPETGTEALTHLLAILKFCEESLDENGFDSSARVLEAHRAQLARGKEWPGDEIDPATAERVTLRIAPRTQ
jgi:hypothetical protein